ncbi:hypothetical protein EOD42_08865 [Rhodovarius crocodyli]|uniref:Uncharacterized protein n=1 Tax=Rhodovarius crocodyli TaxID=1979269 RepID=A0A437MJR8_9PROT|nr:hypothetical protein [Rhodovarius crocodyli]RVT97891.1 hypothetical protein EOD42_08865 [Rhodovarius crocodyli]
MTKLLLSWVNWLDRPGVSITTNSETGGLGVTRLADPILRRRWRSAAGIINPVLTVDLGALREVGVLALAQPDDAGGVDAMGDARGWMRSTDEVRHLLDAATPGGGGVLDTGAQPGGWVPGYGMHMLVPPAALSARQWRAEIGGWSLAAGVGYLDLGRAWIGPAFRPARGNYAYDWGWAMEDGAVVSTNSRSGLDFVDRGPRRRLLTFTLPTLTTAEAEAVRELQRIAGTGRQVLAAIQPDTPAQQANWIIGRLTEIQPITQPAFGVHRASFSIRQSL